MVDPNDPTSGTPANPVAVSVTPLTGRDLAWDMIRRQGPLAIALAVAVGFLWIQWQADRAAYDARQAARETLYSEAAKHIANEHAQAVDKLAIQQTRQLADQAAIFQAEQARIERLLGKRIEVNDRQVKELAAKLEKAVPPNE